jgi:formimidoylglutamate deiminase
VHVEKKAGPHAALQTLACGEGLATRLIAGGAPAHIVGVGRYKFEALFDGVQWRRDVVVEVDDAGIIAGIGGDDVGATDVPGTAVPALPNLHSHAFQRAMAGRAEQRSPLGADSFWTWRDRMYRAVRHLDPDRLRAVATELYRELAARGFGSVAEFHYVHHRADGRPYESPWAMTDALVAAADQAGVRLCLLPVLYQRGGFRAPEPSTAQRPFVLNTAAYLELLEGLWERHAGGPHRVGIAFHSLRAVSLDAIQAVLAHRGARDPEAPVHIHVAEQPREVEECLAVHGRRPVELLLKEVDVDPHWCLVHATHATPDELQGVAERGAVAGLCPTTEANLGDGWFDLPTYLEAGGLFGVGTDSHVSVCPFEELRWLEYGQRLRTGRRHVVDGPTSHVGTNLWAHALVGGARALGLSVGRIAPGYAADWMVLDPGGVGGVPVAERLDVATFGRNAPAVATWSAGVPSARTSSP